MNLISLLKKNLSRLSNYKSVILWHHKEGSNRIVTKCDAGEELEKSKKSFDIIYDP